MAENTRPAVAPSGTVAETAALLLTLGGLTAAFGAATCCALPMLLAGAGLGTTWLIGIAAIVAPHRIALVTATAICLVAGGVVFAWHRRAVACGACGHRIVTRLVAITMTLGVVLAVLGYVYA